LIVVREQATTSGISSGPSSSPVVDLRARTAKRGPLWSVASEDLNATLLAWGPGEGTPEHVNDERDVLLIVLGGSGLIRLDGEEHELEPLSAVVIEKGRRRQIVASPDGIRYLTVHLARGGLQIRRPQRRASADAEG
jgi:quercetin dioxygenase-like cupin family protein